MKGRWPGEGAGVPPDPGGAGNSAEFVDALARLREWAGRPSLRRLRQLGGKTRAVSGEEIDGLPESTVSYVLRGRGLPSLPKLDFVVRFAGVCLLMGGVPEGQIPGETERWRCAWRAVADGSPGGDRAGASSPALAVVSPAQLPAGNVRLAGRAGELKQVTGGLTRSAGTRVVAICGPGGIGKSALAVHAAHCVAVEFPDGQLYVNLRGATPGMVPLRPEEVLARFLRALGVDDMGISRVPDEAAALFRTLTAGKRMLLLLDDAAGVGQLRPLIPAGAGCATLITSRSVPATLEGAECVCLGGLPDDEAADLLGNLAGQDRVAADLEGAREIIRLCGGLPLAVRVAGARLAANPGWAPSDLVRRLATANSRLDELRHGDLAVRTSLAVSHDQLEADRRGHAASRLFVLLGLLDAADYTPVLAAALAGDSADEAEGLLDVLVHAQLLQPPERGRYRMHDLVRLFARELGTQVQGEHAVRQALDFYLATARTATRVIAPGAYVSEDDAGPDLPAAVGVALSDATHVGAWLRTETGNILAVARQAVHGGLARDLVVTLVPVMFRPLTYHGQFLDYLGLSQAADDAATHSGDPAHKLVGLVHLGRAKRLTGRGDETLDSLRLALELARSCGHRDYEAQAYNGIGIAHKNLGQLDAAIEATIQAIEIWREQGNDFEVAWCRTNLGLCLQQSGQHAAAMTAHDEAIATFRRLDRPYALGAAQGHRAEAHRLAGDPAKAADRFHEALETTTAAGLAGSYLEAEQHWNLGLALHELGSAARARRSWREAATILRRLNLISTREYDSIHRSDQPATPEIIRRNL